MKSCLVKLPSCNQIYEIFVPSKCLVHHIIGFQQRVETSLSLLENCYFEIGSVASYPIFSKNLQKFLICFTNVFFFAVSASPVFLLKVNRISLIGVAICYRYYSCLLYTSSRELAYEGVEARICGEEFTQGQDEQRGRRRRPQKQRQMREIAALREGADETIHDVDPLPRASRRR